MLSRRSWVKIGVVCGLLAVGGAARAHVWLLSGVIDGFTAPHPAGVDPSVLSSARSSLPTVYVPEAFDPLPEPAMWSSLLLGFGAVGGLFRVRRGRKAPLA